MPRLFISYRRDDSAYPAHAIYDKLVSRFGEESIFFDVDTIPLGTDFHDLLHDAVAQCDVLLAVIGDNWLTAQDESGQRRLDNPDDFVRIEIEAALSRSIPVVPVLVGKAAVPNPRQLPDSLKPLSYRNAAEVRAGADFAATLERLMRDLEVLLAPRSSEPDKPKAKSGGFRKWIKRREESLSLEEEATGTTIGQKPNTPALPADEPTTDFHHEAKMLLIGQGGAGKTSLVKRLVRDEFDIDEQKTEGISVEVLSLDTDRGAVRLNVWDFGGQEIMHATHQFFLTKRSLYLLVIDARGGDQADVIHYWLRIVQSYADDSPVLIVVNKCDTHQLELDANRLQLDYAPNLHGISYISCATRAGIETLRNEIRRLVPHSLPHIFDEPPHGFLALKAELQSLANENDFIDEDQYRELCRRHGVDSRPDQDKLLRSLHDLGVILHYNDPKQVYQIHDTKVLNPSWVTRGVYKVLNSSQLLRAGDGTLDLTVLDTILNDPDRYPKQRHRFLIGMMQKFELCFEFPDDCGRFLIPELLPVNEPDIGWRDGDVLNFQYEYSVLPRGLIPRLIVRTHHLLTETPTYWRNGVVLSIESCRVLIRGNLREERVFIQVQSPENQGNAQQTRRVDSASGATRRRALAVVRDYFDSLQAGVPRLRAKAKIPLANDPEAPPVDYEYLLQLERDGIAEMRFEGSRQKYRVRELLQGVDERDFDVFLSHNSDDKPVVRELAKLLRAHGVRPWLDEERLTPGRIWQEEMSEALSTCRSIAVLVGRSGFGNWEREETYVALNESAEKRKLVIPILLPGQADEAEVPPVWAFLKSRTWVDLRDGLDTEQLGRLIGAITSAC